MILDGWFWHKKGASFCFKKRCCAVYVKKMYVKKHFTAIFKKMQYLYRYQWRRGLGPSVIESSLSPRQGIFFWLWFVKCQRKECFFITLFSSLWRRTFRFYHGEYWILVPARKTESNFFAKKTIILIMLF